MTGDENEYSAFISYASADCEKAEQICLSLEQRGLRCWIAPRDLRAGREYADEIIHGIERSRCLVLVLSEAANQSAFVRREVERAVSKRKAVFPIRIEEVLPSPSLELFVSSTHWIDAWTGQFVTHVERLARDMSDDGVVERVALASNRIARRRYSPRWVRVVVVFVGLVTAIVIANRLSNRINGPTPVVIHPSPQAAPPSETSVAGHPAPQNTSVPVLDHASFTKDDVKPVVRFVVSDSGHMTEISIETTSRLSEALDRANAFYKLGDGSWKQFPMGLKIPISLGGMHVASFSNDLETVRRSSSVSVKFGLKNAAGTVGPFEFPLDYDRRLSALYKQRTTSNFPWLVDKRFQWTIPFAGELLPALKSIRFGVASDKLDTTVELAPPSPDEALGNHRQLASSAYSRVNYVPESLRGEERLSVQFELLDGATSEVREFVRPRRLAPEFSLKASDDNTYTLSKFRGRPVVLFLVRSGIWGNAPDANFELRNAEYAAAQFDVGCLAIGGDHFDPAWFGRSYNTENFSAGMPFPILGDSDGNVRKQFVEIAKNPFGAVYLDAEGQIVHSEATTDESRVDAQLRKMKVPPRADATVAVSPDYVFQSLDGRTFKLSEFRSKQAVVVAWIKTGYGKESEYECESLNSAADALSKFDVAVLVVNSNHSVISLGRDKDELSAVESRARLIREMTDESKKRRGSTNFLTYCLLVDCSSPVPTTSTTYVDIQGKVRYVDYYVNVKKHGQAIVDRLKALGAPSR